MPADNPLPLDGVRVLDLADNRAALAGRLLADLGAHVTLIEPPGGVDTRHQAPFVDDRPGPERSWQHIYFNANKHSQILDIEIPDDADQLRQLARAADILIETRQPGDLSTLGLGYDDLRVLNPHLIYISATPYGQRGPNRNRRATDLTTQAAAGLLHVSGHPDDPPTRGPAHTAHTMTGLTAASAAMICLHGRDQSPARPGAHVDISMQEATSFQLVQTSNPNVWLWRKERPVRPALSQTIRCKDGKWAACNIRGDGLDSFLPLLDAVGIEHGLTPDDWLVLHAGDRAAWQYLDNPLQDLAKQLAARMNRDDFLRALQADGHPAMPTYSFDEFAESEHYQHAGQFRDIAAPALQHTVSYSRSPLDPVQAPLPIAPAPLLGSAPPAAPSDDNSAQPSTPQPLPLQPLAGIRVLDLTWVAAGPLGARILANFGAEVIKIESMARIDPVRNQPIPGGRFDVNLPDLFNDANANKKSVTLNLSTERGKELFRDLAATADVIVNNYSAGSMERMGLPYAQLCERNPGLVLLHLPGVGGDSPWRKLPTLGNLLMAASGLNFLMGFPDREPRGVGVAYPDFTSPHLLAVSVLAALRARERTGRGREIELSQLSATVALSGAEWMRYAREHQMPQRPGNRDPNLCPHGVYPTEPDHNAADRWVAVAVDGDDQWATFATAIGRSDLADDPRFATHQQRKTNEDQLDALIIEWTNTRDRWHIAELLQNAGIAASPVEDLRDMMEIDDHFKHHYQYVAQPTDPDFQIAVDADPIRFAHEEDRILTRAPMLGEHNEYALRQILNLSQTEFDALIIEGIIA